jgi:hypothetical protein
VESVAGGHEGSFTEGDEGSLTDDCEGLCVRAEGLKCASLRSAEAVVAINLPLLRDAMPVLPPVRTGAEVSSR